MATDLGPNLDLSIPAGGDLTSSQFLFVKLSGANVVACTAVTDTPFGVLQNKPASGEMAQVRVLGVTKIVAGAALATVGAVIGPNASGQAAARTILDAGANQAAGRTLTVAGGASEVIRALVNCVFTAKAS